MKTFQEIQNDYAKERGYDNFNLMYGQSAEFRLAIEYIVELYAQQLKQPAPEPTEEEIRSRWSDWYDENGGNNTQDAWIEAINWYKTQINR